MILNAYDTTVGKPFKVADHITNTLKTLALMNNLSSPNSSERVYTVTHDVLNTIPVFSFPISLIGHDKKPMTVVDVRPYTNKSGKVINQAEYDFIYITGRLQQLLSVNDLTFLKSGRILTTRAYARSLAQRFASKGGLDVNEAVMLQIIFGVFYICQLEKTTDDYAFVAANILKQALGIDSSTTIPIIEEMGFINDLPELLNYITHKPELYKLSSLTMKEVIALGSTIWYSSVGKQVVGAALEHPCLFTAMVYATTQNKMFAKTNLGLQLDPKYNGTLIESFTKVIGQLL